MPVDIFEKLILGKTFEEATRIPTAQQAISRLEQALTSNFPLRILGLGADEELSLSEEMRAAHWHIVGSTRQGKSKLIESLVRHDLDNGYGCTLLDPSENASTAHSILRYCIKHNYKNVIWIDLNDAHVIPTINPLTWRGPAAASGKVAACMDAVRLLWAQNEWQATARIQTYLKALFTALYFAKATIPDAVAFLAVQERGGHNPILADMERKRRQIMNELPPTSEARITLEQVFTSRATFLTDFQPTIRRLNPFFDPLPRLIFGSTDTPLNFEDIVRNKTCLLVNLDMRGVGGDDLRRLIGTFIINGLVNAVSYLNKRTEWKGRHYLYMDEAGLFVTSALTDIMAYQGKSGLWATIAHHYYRQFEDQHILEGIENLSHIKCLFFVGNPYDRDRMVKSMYFGELAKCANEAAANLKKQQMMIRVGKEPARVVTVVDVPDVPNITPAQLGEFKEQIYNSNSFYRKPETIEEEIKQRFNVSKPQQRGGQPDQPKKNSTRSNQPQPGDDSHPTGQVPPVGQDGPITETFLTSRRRKRRKRVSNPGSYSHTTYILRTWEDKLWKRMVQLHNESDVWLRLDDRRRVRKPNEDEDKIRNLAHWLSVSDLFAAFKPTGKLEYWDRKWTTEEWNEYDIDEYQVRYDARAKIAGKALFFECDRNNEECLPRATREKATRDRLRKSFNLKIERYISFSKAHPDEPFHVLITVEDWHKGYYDPDGSIDRVTAILNLLRDYDRHKFMGGRQFLVGLHRDVVGDKDEDPQAIQNEVLGDPLGNVWLSPADPQTPLSLTDL